MFKCSNTVNDVMPLIFHFIKGLFGGGEKDQLARSARPPRRGAGRINIRTFEHHEAKSKNSNCEARGVCFCGHKA
jgi:hypothetical protein